LVVRQIRGRIDELWNDPDKAEELKTFKAAFHRLAEELFDSASKNNLSPEKMYPIEQMWAEAILAGGKNEDALKFFEKCAAYDAAICDEKNAVIDNEINSRIDAVGKS